MGLKGGLAGGLLGLACGGPLGAILGAVAGNSIERDLGGESGSDGTAATRGSAGGGRTGGRPGRSREEEGTLLRVAVISLLAKVAKADGRVDPREVAEVDRFFKDSLGLRGEDRKTAIRIFEAAKASAHDPGELASQVRECFDRDRRALRDLLSVLVRVAAADGSWAPGEDRVLTTIAGRLGFPVEELGELKRLHFHDAGEDYAVLGLAPGASDAEVAKAFKHKAREFHPDRIAAKELPPAFLEFAKQQFQRVQEAYDRIRASRGKA